MGEDGGDFGEKRGLISLADIFLRIWTLSVKNSANSRCRGWFSRHWCAGEALNVAITAKNQAEDAYNRAVKELEDAQAEVDRKANYGQESLPADNTRERPTGQDPVSGDSNENRSEQKQASGSSETGQKEKLNQASALNALQEAEHL